MYKDQIVHTVIPVEPGAEPGVVRQDDDTYIVAGGIRFILINYIYIYIYIYILYHLCSICLLHGGLPDLRFVRRGCKDKDRIVRAALSSPTTLDVTFMIGGLGSGERVTLRVVTPEATHMLDMLVVAKAGGDTSPTAINKNKHYDPRRKLARRAARAALAHSSKADGASA